MYNTNEHIGPRAMKYFIDKKMAPCLEKMNLTASCGPLLLELMKHDGASMKDLATYTMVDKSLVTRACKQLIEEEFVINKSTVSRQYSLSLTEKGIAATVEIKKMMNEIMAYLTEDFTPEEKATLRTIDLKIKKKVMDDIKDEHHWEINE